mmetsp:Transcript_30573/g.87340  ORF Transcript_30573/g.87340 Transcript_30573/m.87340 type:complete len:114 (-) Transcript_30573:4-345(-)
MRNRRTTIPRVALLANLTLLALVVRKETWAFHLPGPPRRHHDSCRILSGISATPVDADVVPVNDIPASTSSDETSANDVPKQNNKNGGFVDATEELQKPLIDKKEQAMLIDGF